MLKKIRALIIKEFISVWQDKRSRAALIAPPIIQFFVFTFAATLDVHNVSLGIQNNDMGQPAHELVERFKGSPEFTDIVILPSHQAMKDALDGERILVAVQIKKDFSRKVLSGERGEVLVIADGRKSNAAQIVTGYITDIVGRYNATFERAPPAAELKPRNWYNPNLNYTWFTITGLIGILSMLTSLSVTALSIAREKEMGTFEQLLVSPLSPTIVLIGKAVPAIVIGVAEGTAMLLAGIIFLSLPLRGNLLMLYPSMIVFVFAIVGIGLFISTLAKTQQQSLMGVLLAMTPLVIMSGFATPVENMPWWLQYFAQLNPLKFFLVIARGIFLKDISTLTILNNTWPMLLIAFGTLGAAGWLFRRRIG